MSLRCKKAFLAVFFLFCCELLPGQDTLTLESCYKLAAKNYPMSAQLDMIAGSNLLKVKNLNKNYLPQFNINGQLSYQSDVTHIEITMPAGIPAPEIPQMSKDIYKATLDISQVIWDGNVTSYQKKLESYNLKIDQTNVEAELYKLKERVNQFFFAVVLFNKNEHLLKTTRVQLEGKLKEVKAGIQFGAVLQSTADALEAEIIRLDQSIEETRIERSTAYAMLSELLATDIPENTPLALPELSIPDFTYENQRLEILSFDLQRSRLDVMRNMVTTKWNPKFYAFGQAGLGKPGLNMLSDKFDPFYLIGAKLTWAPWNWNANKNEKKIMEIQSSVVQTQKETLDKNLKIQTARDWGEILKARSTLDKDLQIIALRERISASSSAQMDNGIITSSEYVNRLTEERQARLNYEIHLVQLVKAQLSYLFNQGKL